MISIEDWSGHFPFNTIREEQEKAINFALNAYKSGKRFVICEVGTGGGKSAIGLTIARYVTANFSDDDRTDFLVSYQPGAYFLTTQKLLQDQYVKDFGAENNGSMCQIMSAANYQCKSRSKMNCAEVQQMIRAETADGNLSKSCKFSCVYKTAKKKFIDSSESITNFSYFLAETAYVGKLEPRSLLVVDEAHNADTELSGFIEVMVSERFAKQLLKYDMPDITTQKQAWKFVSEEYAPRVKAHIDHYAVMIEKFNLADKMKVDFAKITKQYEMLEKHYGKILQFMQLYDEDNWIFNLVEGEGRGMRKLEFKPVDVSTYAEQILFKSGKRVLLMSATILNKEGFCKMLGIKDEECEFISIPSPFPPENHPIFTFPVARMTAAHIEQDLSKLTSAVKAILAQHPNEKGIIHCIDENASISMGDGTLKSLIDVNVGDLVVTWSEKSNSFENKKVLANLDMGQKKCIKINFENGNSISCTPDHRFLTSNRGWVEAQNLIIEDDIISFD